MAERLIARAVAVVALFALLAACDSDPAPPVPHSVSLAPAHAVTGGTAAGRVHTFELVDGAKVVQVRAADLHGHLYRVSTPTASAVFPVVNVVDGTVKVTLPGGGDADLSVTLDDSVAWSLRFDSGISTASVDMRSAQLRGLTTLQGVSTLDVTAGQPSGKVTLAEAAGVGAFALHVPPSTPVTVDVHAGAGTVTLFGTTHSGVAAGTSLASGAGPDRYAIDAQAGVSTVTVDSTA